MKYIIPIRNESATLTTESPHARAPGIPILIYRDNPFYPGDMLQGKDALEWVAAWASSQPQAQRAAALAYSKQRESAKESYCLNLSPAMMQAARAAALRDGKSLAVWMRDLIASATGERYSPRRPLTSDRVFD